MVGRGLVGMEGWGDGEVVGGGLVGMEGWGDGEVVGGGLVGMEGWGDGEVVGGGACWYGRVGRWGGGGRGVLGTCVHVEGVEMWGVKETLRLPDKGVVGVAWLGVEGGAKFKRVGGWKGGWGGCRPFIKGVIGRLGGERWCCCSVNIGNWME